MDDYMIDKSQCSSQVPYMENEDHKRYIQQEIPDKATEDDIHKVQTNFYSQNYFSYEMCVIDDPILERVWNLQFDKTNDIVFVLLARVKILEG